MKTMKKIVMLSGLFMSGVAYAKVISIASPADFERETKSGIVVVKFFAPWCSACKGMKAPYESIAKEFPDVKFLEVDVDTVKKVADAHDIRSLPTFKYFVDGKEQSHLTHFGGGSASDIKNNVNSLSGKKSSSSSKSQGKKSAIKPTQQHKTAHIQNDRTRENELLRLFNSKSKEEQENIIALLYAPLKEKNSVLKKIKSSAQYAGTKIKDGFSWTKNKIKSLV